MVNDVFNIGAKEFTTMKEDYQAVLDKMGNLDSGMKEGLNKVLEAIDNNTLTALTLLIAESNPKEKNIIVTKDRRFKIFENSELKGL